MTKREQFLTEMNAIIPWRAVGALITPHDPKPGCWRPPMPLDRTLRIYFLQQWVNSSDPAAEDAIYDSEAMRHFVGVEVGDDAFPDESTILRFRHLLERHQLTEAMFEAVRGLLDSRGLLMRRGTIVDTTILSAPSSTKHIMRTWAEMKQVRKGNRWHFGMKVHVGTDLLGIVHSITTTDAAAAEMQQLPELLHVAEKALYGGRAYWSESDRQAAEANGVKDRRRRTINRARARVRAYCEHPFLVVKRLWGFEKVRYRGLAKSTARVFRCVRARKPVLASHRIRGGGGGGGVSLGTPI